MITRTAIFEGTIKPGLEDRFFSELHERLFPLWEQFPQASNVRLHRIDEADAEAPPLVMIQQIDYPSKVALEEALASPIRTQARAVTMELMEMFEGRFYHYVSHAKAVEANA